MGEIIKTAQEGHEVGHIIVDEQSRSDDGQNVIETFTKAGDCVHFLE